MEHRTQLIVVDASVLPEVISKVLEVKKLLAGREEKSSAAACKRVGISRSAYYKYKNCVYSYEDKITQRIINLQAVLRDEAGVLSNVLSALYDADANILTVNQNIPIDSVASVTFSVRLNGEVQSPHQLEAVLRTVQGVVDVKILSGE
ncbi:MAG: ACT domain-containing protein [Oscillospiraceae bacterium]|jgi:chorismate mutase|nr:ACT domain-containing protein [Oscillospiraceae bacterium]MBQ8010783.1 ACT domain-containing protein [Oscillospiraceae bacterium]MBQ9111880.1 ACT domain-containing protein [Oscillospiraceae bacterium]